MTFSKFTSKWYVKQKNKDISILKLKGKKRKIKNLSTIYRQKLNIDS